MSITIKENILTNNDCYKSGRTITPTCIQLHSIGTAQSKATALMSYWNQSGIEACVHYLCDAYTENTVYHILPDNRRSWADAGYGNGNAITIEMMESCYMQYSSGGNFTITNSDKFMADIKRSYNTAVQLCAKLCTEHGWDPTAKQSNGLYTIFSHDEGRIAGVSSAHVDPSHIFTKMGYSMDAFRKAVKECMGNTETSEEATHSAQGASGVPANKQAYIDAVAEITVSLYSETKILPSVVIAQCCLETGYGLGSDSVSLVEVNNLLGMKADLINNTWKEYTAWDGKQMVKITPEYINGKLVYKNDYFRCYENYAQCIRDYEMFLLYVRNDSGYKYRKVQGMTDPEEVITAISKGGYATDPSYITKVMKLIRENGFTKYDDIVLGKEKEVVDVSHPWLKVASNYNKIMKEDVASGIKWYYSNSGCKNTWKGARTAKLYKTNCAKFVVWIFRNQKILTAGQWFYGNSGTIKYKTDATKKNIEAKCTVIHVAGKKTVNQMISDGSLKAGDVVMYQNLLHTNMYAGSGHWYDAGTCYEKEHGEGAKFTNWYGKTMYGSEPVSYIIRMKDTSSTTTTNTSTSSKGYYRVQAGAYIKKAKAEEQVSLLKKKGYDSFIEKSGLYYKVICGSYTVKANASARATALKKSGIDAFIQ